MNSATFVWSSSVAEFVSPLDVAVFTALILTTIASIIWGHRTRGVLHTEKESFLDHLLMGRRLTLPLFVATLVASWYGGIFGVTEIAFKHGVYNFLTQGVFWYVTYIIFAMFLVDRIAAFEAVTLPDLVSKMYGPRAGRVAAVFNFFNVLPVAYCLSLGLFLQMLLGWSLIPAMALGTGLVVVYSMWGGFRSDVYSDLVQFAVMCAGVLLVVIFAYLEFGGWEYLRTQLPITHFEPLGGHSWANTLVWGFIALATLVDPNFYQRCFAAKEARIAKRGILISTVIWCAFDLCTTLGAMYARAVMPDAPANTGYLFFALQVLHHGLRGLFLAAIVAIIVSTLDSFLIIASHTISFDLMPERWRGRVQWQRYSTVTVGMVATVMALAFDGSIKTVWKTLGSYSAGCLLIPMLIGYIRPRLFSERSFILASLLGAGAITYWRLASHQGFWAEVDELYVGMGVTSAGLVLGKVLR